jgi:hypothetical protein
VKTPITIAPEALDFTQLIRAGETVGWAEATAEPVFLTRMLDARAERCPPFRVFFPLTFSEAFAAGHANVTVTALVGWRREPPDATSTIHRRRPREPQHHPSHLAVGGCLLQRRR